MEVSHTNNQYQALQTQQRPVILPTPEDPKYSDKEVYEASQGNISRGKDGELSLTPQGQTNVNNAQAASEAESAAAAQESKDAARSTATNYLAASSKKSQVEIYLAVATEGKADSNNQTADIISSLRDVQKQNNAVQAYAQYQESQKDGAPALF